MDGFGEGDGFGVVAVAAEPLRDGERVFGPDEGAVCAAQGIAQGGIKAFAGIGPDSSGGLEVAIALAILAQSDPGLRRGAHGWTVPLAQPDMIVPPWSVVEPK